MFIFSGCGNVADSRFVDHQETLPSFKDFVGQFLKDDTFIPAKHKEDLPLFMPAEYAGAGVRRCAANVLQVHSLVLDIDKGEQDSFFPIFERIEKYGYIFYTSFNHDPNGQWKFRLIIKLNRPVGIAEWPAFWGRAIRLLEVTEVVDLKCADACHMYFTPGGDPDKYQVDGKDGGALDVDAVLALDLPPGVSDFSNPHYQEVLDEADRGEIDEGLKDYWEAKLVNLCEEIHRRPYPGEIYDLKSHGVYGIARGVPHIITEERVRKMVVAALDYRYKRAVDVAPGDRERSFTQVDKAIADGKAKPWYPPKIDEQEAHPMTDMGLAERLLDMHHKNIRWVGNWERWVVWNEMLWSIENGRELVKRFMMETVRAIVEESEVYYHDYWVAKEEYERLKEATEIKEEERTKAERKFKILEARIEAIEKFALASENRSKISAGVDLANADARVLASHNDFNLNPWLVNFKNGTLDLRTGMLREHRREDYITALAPHDFSLNAECPRFEKFLSECMCGNESLVSFLWRLFGYTAIGVTSEQILVLNVGDGANGKTTCMNVLLDAFGRRENGYGFAANSENLLTTQGSSRHETWRMDLFGKRFVTCQEVEEGRTFAEALIKELTGSDPITGRKMRQDNWTYETEHQLWLSANHLPHVRGIDEGIWRRLVVVPWQASFKGREDRTLGEKLRKEIPGIWARIAREALLWRERGLEMPDEVKAATAEYRREQDPLEPFLETWCAQEKDAFIARDVLWGAYLEYAENARSQIFKQKKVFYAAMAKRFRPHKRVGVNGFAGLRLMTPQERLEASPKTKLLKSQKYSVN